MAFDRTNAADLLALKTEVNTDPAAMGYVPTGSTAELLDKLNNPASNVGAETGSAPMTAKELLKVLFDEAVSSQDQFKIQLLYEGTAGLEDDLSEYKTRVSGLSANIATAVSLIVRPLSRAEVLFADDDANGVKEFVTISREDWFAARDS